MEIDWILEEWVLHQCQIQTVVKWTRLDEEEIRYVILDFDASVK